MSNPAPRQPGPAEVAEQVTLGRLGDYLGFRLRRVQDQLSRRFAAATADLGMRPGLFSSLALIAANPGISQSDLSREIGHDKSGMVAMLDDLEKLGWAVRERSQHDRRRHALRITPEGQARLDDMFAVLAKTEAEVLRQLSDAEIQLLSELLDRMYAVLHTSGRSDG
jgi:DNA-binding MarR family transcriptional regulator